MSILRFKKSIKTHLKDFIEERKNIYQIEKRSRYIKRKVPYTCYYCEILGICRDEDNDWKCRHGCLLLKK